MHIILLVLKILGITLLVLLSIVLLFILLGLFVPVNYRVNAEKQDDIKIKAFAKWLFPLLYAKVDYVEGRVQYRICIFGITVFPREKKEKVRVKRKSKEKKGKKEKEDKNSDKEPDLSIMEVSAPRIEEKEPQNIADVENESTDDFEEKDENHEKKITKRTKKLEKIKEKIVGFLETIKIFKGKGNLILNFLKQEENKKGIGFIFHALKHILKHIIPKKLRGQIELGLEDPCQTGQALGALGVVFSIYGEGIRIIPNFEEPCFKGNVFIKGRVQVFTLVRICIKLLLDDNFKQLKINYNKMKEAL